MTRQIYMYINLVQKSQNLQVKLLDCSNESGAQWGSVGVTGGSVRNVYTPLIFDVLVLSLFMNYFLIKKRVS